MAPNTKQLNLAVQHLSASDLVVSKQAAFAPLTQETQAQEASSEVPVNYWDWSDKPDESDNYWDWSANPKADILSSTHIVENIVKSHKMKDDLVYSGVDSNDYWDDRNTKDRETVTAQHINEDAVNSYWDWASVDDEREDAIAKILEDERIRYMLSADHITECLQKSGSHSYWSGHEPAPWTDSEYWYTPNMVNVQ